MRFRRHQRTAVRPRHAAVETRDAPASVAGLPRMPARPTTEAAGRAGCGVSDSEV